MTSRSKQQSGRHLRGILFGEGLFGRFIYLGATQAVTLLLGAGYWVVSARYVAADQVGIVGAAISAATLLSAIGVLGISTFLLSALGVLDRTEQRALVTTSATVASVVVGVLAIGTWGLSDVLGPSLGALGRDPVTALLFVLGTVLTTGSSVFDAAALGLGKNVTRLVRNVLTSLLKVALVGVIVLVHVRTTTGLLIGWDISIVLSLIVWPLLKLERHVHIGIHMRVDLIRRYWRTSLGHHALNLAVGSMSYLLSMVAALLVVPREVAYFTVAQLVAGSTMAVPFLLTLSLFVESTGDAPLLRRNVRKTFPTGIIVCLAILALLEPGAHLILSAFSSPYATSGTTPLRLLLLAGLPYVVKDHYMAIRRAQGRLQLAAKIGALSAAIEVLAAVIGGWRFGLDGLCGGWAIATFIEVGFYLPSVRHVLFDSTEPTS